MSTGNVHRATAARLLLVFAGLVLAASLFSLRIRRAAINLEWVDYPTALGDLEYYDHEAGLEPGKNDFFEPVLVFEARPQGLYRRNHKPQERPDGAMYKVGRDEKAGLNVYAWVKRINGVEQMEPPETRRFFLKTGENRYIEFGQREYWP